MINNSKISLALAASIFFATAGPVVIAPTPAYSISFGEKLKKDFRKIRKKVRKDIRKGGGRRALQVIGLGLAVYGIADDSPAAAILGLTLAAAPEIFKRDIAQSYGRELDWAGCTNCNRRRIIVAPNRELSKKRRSAITSRTKEDVKDIQGALKDLGYYKKRIDGDFGPGTRAGVKEFQLSLGDRATGVLTSEQRYRLFIQAERSGYTRRASLNEIDEATAIPVGSVAAGARVPDVASKPKMVIAEFALAKSQFDKFSDEFLKSGSQTSVSDANLLSDGSIELTVKDIAKDQTTKLTGSVAGLELKPHHLADEWARVTYSNTDTETPIILNTRDDLGSAEDAAMWIEKGKKSLKLLAQLTGAVTADDSEIVVVSNEDHKAAQEGLGAGNVVVNEKMEGFDTLSADEICRQNLYVSWQFPQGESPINHYNISTPEGVIMMDNGDSTAYLTGSCVLGKYDFSYVYVKEGKTQKDWKHFKREGSFQIAQNAEQCTIDLNNPDGSAAVQCY